MEGRRCIPDAYFVRLVIVLRVILEDFGLLLIVKGANEVINPSTELFPPLLAINEPIVTSQKGYREDHDESHEPTSASFALH